ncbi:replication initiation protein [Marinobacter salsuginis]|uniref:replication initiation protein n=1 Tax=Marinobacter salsuginis TaxID=418719 RepID=UPI00273D8BFD|nr:replication initiation protein [Marinobacter salsuginis]
MAERTARTYTPPYQYRNQRSPLSRVIEEMPYLARCSDNKTAGLVRPREFAVKHPYIQVNRANVVSWLIFDLDHANATIWQDQDLPPPNLVVRNRRNGKAHLFYAIEPVLTGENARAKPIAFMNAVYDAFRMRLDADAAYSGPVAKTPGHRWWETTEFHDHVYDLAELAEHVELTVKPYWSKEPNLDSVAHSRHCTLFEKLRFFAYSIVGEERDKGSYQSFCRKLRQFANQQNCFSLRGHKENLRQSQVRATVKSVGRWTWTRYTGRSDCHRGVMALNGDLPLDEKQRLAAKRTHQVRRTVTERTIRQACEKLKRDGQPLTMVGVAKVAGVSRQTIARYRHVLNESPQRTQSDDSKVLHLPLRSLKPVFVSYGVYQISALRLRVALLGDEVGIVDWLNWVRRQFEPGRGSG